MSRISTPVPGLHLYPEFITAETDTKIVAELDQYQWSNSLTRRTQHYGYEYDYKSHTAAKKAASFPPLISAISDILAQRGFIKSDQCIVNEYVGDQGISKHTDAKVFGPVIVSLSLTAATNFVFRSMSDGSSVEIEVPARALLYMSEDSRHTWTHEIPRRKTYTVGGARQEKSSTYRRISLTFRTMNSK